MEGKNTLVSGHNLGRQLALSQIGNVAFNTRVSNQSNQAFFSFKLNKYF